MGFFARTDERIINEIAEPFAWRIEYRFGYNCFDLSRTGYTLGALCHTLGWGLTEPALLRFFGPLMGLAWLGVMMSLSNAEHLVVTRPHHMNPAKAHWYFRVVPAFLLLFNIVNVFPFTPIMGNVCNIFGTIFFVCGFYFASCNVMPAHWEPPQREEVVADAFQGA